MKVPHTGNIVDLHTFKIFYGIIWIEDGKIVEIVQLAAEQPTEVYLLPGFVDAHVHIESSLLTPANFGRLAVLHGTVGTVSDPHEIANVLGVSGVDYMIDDAKKTPLKIMFGAPSCVPATVFETAGASISVDDIDQLLARDDIGFLAEMMNYPGVLYDDEEVIHKLHLAKLYEKPIDGHAPGLRGVQALKYFSHGISTDHECYQYEEALDKLKIGVKVLIREGSAAKNFDALEPLIDSFYENIMFCSDDLHPDLLIKGHINLLVKRALDKGHDLFKVLTAACINPVKHYKMNIGLLRVGDPADFIEVEDLKDFTLRKTFIDGQMVAKNGETFLAKTTPELTNNFDCELKSADDFKILNSKKVIKVIEAIDGQLITKSFDYSPKEGTYLTSDLENDILKIAVINRYSTAPISIGFIKNFGLKEGAIASSVAHDSHNIIVVGVDDDSMSECVNLVIQTKGGLAAVSNTQRGVLALPVAGLMSNEDGAKVANDYEQIDLFVKKQLGSTLTAPFMTLSFMALLVIPSLKISDKGLFDGEDFKFVV